jgi:hypothetical protein
LPRQRPFTIRSTNQPHPSCSHDPHSQTHFSIQPSRHLPPTSHTRDHGAYIRENAVRLSRRPFHFPARTKHTARNRIPVVPMFVSSASSFYLCHQLTHDRHPELHVKRQLHRSLPRRGHICIRRHPIQGLLLFESDSESTSPHRRLSQDLSRLRRGELRQHRRRSLHLHPEREAFWNCSRPIFGKADIAHRE